MEDHVKALLYAIGYLGITIPHEQIVIRDRWCALYSSHFSSAKFICPFAGQKMAWEKAGHIRVKDEDGPAVFLLHCPQQSLEADYEIATALSALKAGGLLMVVADNQAGGKSLSKKLAAFGCPVQDLSKHKCRVVWTSAPEQASPDKIQAAIKAGDIHTRNVDGLYTQAGVFSWEHRDKGTEILLQHLPQSLSGHGADFGCGIGEISRFILATCPHITTLTCIDHDSRAVLCCMKNTSAYQDKVSVLCQDIPQQTSLKGLNFIVMNPPFHNGKIEDKTLGLSFIIKAANALNTGGTLYMVANSHLPYEDTLSAHFSQITLLAKENGFKIFAAVR
jgi:16S rRNA (guanine1207-N2)-methyltransferase